MLAWQIALIVIAVVVCIKPLIYIVCGMFIGVIRVLGYFKHKRIMKRMNQKD